VRGNGNKRVSIRAIGDRLLLKREKIGLVTELGGKELDWVGEAAPPPK